MDQPGRAEFGERGRENQSAGGDDESDVEDESATQVRSLG